MDNLEKAIKGLECCLDVQSGWKDAVWVCPACPYASNDGKPCETLAPLLEDALALLNAKPRVMTLDEVRAAEVVWLEQVGACVCAIKIQNFDSGTMSFAYEYNNFPSFVNIKPKYYGKISRCWTSRPTDAQMEATPWND